MCVWNSLAVLVVVSESAEKSKHSSWSNIKHQPTFNCIKTSWPVSGCTDIHNSFQVWQIAWHHCMLLLAVVVRQSASRISRSSSKQRVDKICKWKRLSLKHPKNMHMHMNSCTYSCTKILMCGALPPTQHGILVYWNIGIILNIGILDY